jgi:hypothetical protein
MKKLRSILRKATAVSAAAAVVAVGVSTPAAAANLLGNPGFESGALSPWSCSLGSVVSTPVHTGTKALQGAASSSDNA